MEKKKRSGYVRCISFDNLINEHRIPMLFIGSGISKRYLKNYPSWDGLIRKVAETIGVSSAQLIAIKQSILNINPDETQGRVYAKMGSELSQIFINKVKNEEIKLSDVFTEKEINLIDTKNISFTKMLISKLLSSYEVSKHQKELAEFKKLQNHIGVVVTTNYDKFLERELFNNFDVFYEQTQYYMTETTGIGEIYKIHGSVDSPNSIVFTAEDYDNFRDNLRVVAAKLLNLALEYPIIFMGYSLEDENVMEILNTLIDSLNKEQLANLSKNLIYINWKKQEYYLKESEKTIHKNGKTLRMTNISTDNYLVLFKYLQKFIPSEKPERVRKYKKMIRNLVIKSNGGQATIIANTDIDKLNNEDKLVVAFGAVDEFALKGITGINAKDLTSWVLDQKCDITSDLANRIIEDFYLTSAVARNHYVPIYYLLNFNLEYKDNDKLLNMKQNLEVWTEKINSDNKIPLLESYDAIMAVKPNQAEYKYMAIIAKSYSNNTINYSECLELLKDYKNDNPIVSSEYRKAITYLDMKKFY